MSGSRIALAVPPAHETSAAHPSPHILLAEATIRMYQAVSEDEVLRMTAEQAARIVGARLAASLRFGVSDAGDGAVPEGVLTPEAVPALLALDRAVRLSASPPAPPSWSTRLFPEGGIPADGWMAAPLLGPSGRGFGVIQLLGSYRGAFTDDDEALLVQLARATSGALESLRLRDAARAEIEERARMQRALQESRERYRQLFDASPLPFFLLDPASASFVAVNRAATEQYGYSAAEFEQLSLWDIRPAREYERLRQTLQGMRAGEEVSGVRTHLTRDGREVEMEVHTHVIELDGRRLQLAVLQDISARLRQEEALRQAREALLHSRQELRELAARLQTVRERERTHIAREIHDELGQALTGLKMQLFWLRRQLRSSNSELEGAVGEMVSLVDTTLDAMRGIVTELRPGVLDDLGLVAALTWQAREFSRHLGIPCRVEVGRSIPELPDDAATAVFRILQESLTNVARHAQATQVKVSLSAQTARLVLRIEDDGVGIQAGTAEYRPALGLLGMRERALALGGSVEITGARGAGTVVTLSLPFTV